MTTIACNLESMSGDSMCSWDDHKGFLTPKVFRVGSSIYGLAGDNFANVFLEWAKTGFKPKLKPSIMGYDPCFDVIELHRSGIYLWDSYLVRMQVKDTNYAIGSGSKVAILGMREIGLSPHQAVELACRYDDYTRGPIDTLKIKEASGATGPENNSNPEEG